jgi:hypothetical protein
VEAEEVVEVVRVVVEAVLDSLKATRRSSVGRIEGMSCAVAPRPVLAVSAWVVGWAVILGDLGRNARSQHVLQPRQLLLKASSNALQLYVTTTFQVLEALLPFSPQM